MPVTPTYPGVYVEEIPSGVRTITGVATSITAFIGRALRGPTNEPILINNYGEYERIFGGLWNESTMSFAVRDFYNNGGSQAVIVRLFHPGELQATSESELNEQVLPAVEAIKGAGNKDAGIAAAKTYLDDDDDGSAGDDPNTWPEQETVTGRVAKEMAIEIYALDDGIEGDDYTEEVEKIIADLQIMPKARLSVGTTQKLELEAANEGVWGNGLQARVDYDGITGTELFNLSVKDGSTGEVETFLNVSVDENETRYVEKVLEKDSQLVRMTGTPPANRPEANDSEWADIETTVQTEVAEQVTQEMAEEQGLDPEDVDGWTEKQQEKRDARIAEGVAAEEKKFKAEGLWYELCSNGVDVYTAGDGDLLVSNDFTEGESDKKGIYALENADLFNLLCIPPYNVDANADSGVIDAAIIYCEKRRAMMIIDSPSDWNNKEAAKSGIETDVGSTSNNAAIFFPRLKMSNPLKDNQIEVFAACGAVAGIFARTDATRGVWKAPAGLEAVLRGVAVLSVPLTDPENGELNPLGINCLRNKPPAGKIVWGSRTRVGDDRLASEWKYIPVRRLALYMEETLYRNTKWAVFEPNDEPLWAQLRLSIGSFMSDLFRKGAFQGSSPKDAYFVKCDKETTTQYDIDRGIVNILIGFAPLKPAEFVILKFQQIAGQS